MAPISQVWCACSETPRRWRHTVASGCACRRRSSRNGSNAALIAVPASAASSRDCPSGRASSMAMDRARLAGKASPPWRRSVQPARACGAPHRLRPNTRRPASWSRRRGVEAEVAKWDAHPRTWPRASTFPNGGPEFMRLCVRGDPHARERPMSPHRTAHLLGTHVSPAPLWPCQSRRRGLEDAPTCSSCWSAAAKDDSSGYGCCFLSPCLPQQALSQ